MDKETIRRAHNFLYQTRNNDYAPQDIETLASFERFKPDLKKFKVALVMVGVNTNYWQYALQVVEDVQKNFLPGHDTDIFMWSDMPQWNVKDTQKKIDSLDDVNPDKQAEFFDLVGKYIEALYLGSTVDESMVIIGMRRIGLETEFMPSQQPLQQKGMRNLMVKNVNGGTLELLRNSTRVLLTQYKNLIETCTLTEMEPIEWPYGTLMRYSMFLQKEEELKDYDYIFYMDVDMRVVNVVGDEILGPGLTIAPHPGYALRKELWPPYEPNDQSASYIKRPGKVVMMEGKPRFHPFYAAGGFQGGTAESYIRAMKETKKLIDKDFNINYIPIWNDETAWNKYVFDVQTKEEIDQTVFLTPSYIYPDSLIREYYEKFWGQSYPPKIITLTKPFTTQKVDMSKFNTM